MTERIALYSEISADATKLPAATYTVTASDAVRVGQSDYECDGVADQVQIQSAIDAADAAGGGVVQLSEGTFIISAAVDLASNVWLRGAGVGTTITVVTGSGTGFSMIDVDEANNVRISNIKLDGNGSNVTGNLHGIYVHNSASVVCLDCLYTTNGSGVGYGVLAATSSDLTISNSYLDSWANDAIEVRDTNRAMIHGNFFPAGGSEVYCSALEIDIIFSNNHFVDHNLLCTNNGGNTKGLTIAGNTFRWTGSGNKLCRLRNVDGLVIHGNSFDCPSSVSQTNALIEIENTVTHAIVSGNRVRFPASVVGILAEGVQARVGGNQFIFEGNAGIGVKSDDATASYLAIHGNDFIGDGSMADSYGVQATQVSGAEIRDNWFRGMGHGVYVGASSANVTIGADNRYDDVTTETEVV